MNNIKTLAFGICIFLFASFLCQGCSDEVALYPDEKKSLEGTKDSVMVNFNLNVSAPEAHNAKTRSAGLDENNIENVQVLVLTQSGSTEPFRYAYSVSGNVVATTAGVTTVHTSLKTSASPVKAYILANTSSLIPVSMNGLVIGTTEEDLKNQLIFNRDVSFELPAGYENTLQFTGTHIPMWGEVTFGSVTADTPTTANIKLYRAMAKISITVDPALAADFVHTGTYIAGEYPILAMVSQQVDAFGKITDVRMPDFPAAIVIPPYANLYSSWPNYVSPAMEPAASFYVPEQKGIGTVRELAAGLKKGASTSIIIKGKYRGEEDSYYKLVVKTDSVYGKIVRNHHYNVTLKSIAGTGAKTLKEAIENARFHFVYDINEMDMGEGMTYISFDNLEKLEAAHKIIFMPEPLLIDNPDLWDDPSYEGPEITKIIPLNTTLPKEALKLYYYNNTLNQYIHEPLIENGAEPMFYTNYNNMGIELYVYISEDRHNLVVKMKRGFANVNNPKFFTNIGNFLLSNGTKALELGVSLQKNVWAGIEGATTPYSAKNVEIANQGGDQLITVRSTAPWEVRGVPDWIKVVKNQAGNFTVSVAEAQSNTSRECLLSVVNAAGEVDHVRVYQHNKIEWAAANSKGGAHRIKETEFELWYPYYGEYVSFVSSTPDNSPVTFADPAGDVGIMTPETKGTYTVKWPLAQYPGTQTHYDPARPTYSNMFGDRYGIMESGHVCPPGWRLPTLPEVRMLVSQLKWSGKTLYLEQNGARIYFPVAGFRTPTHYKMQYGCFSHPSSNVGYALSSNLARWDNPVVEPTIDLFLNQHVSGVVRCVR